MLATPPYPAERHPVGILDLSPVLRPSPPLPQDLLGSVLPSIDYLLVAVRLGELYEVIFPQFPAHLEEVVAWQNEEAVAKVVERFLSYVADLFPIQDECWEMEMEIITWRLYAIPVVPQGFDLPRCRAGCCQCLHRNHFRKWFPAAQHPLLETESPRPLYPRSSLAGAD